MDIYHRCIKHYLGNSFNIFICFILFLLFFCCLFALASSVQAIEFVGEEEVPSTGVMEEVTKDKIEDSIETSKDYVESPKSNIPAEGQHTKDEEIKVVTPIQEEPKQENATPDQPEISQSENNSLKTAVEKESLHETSPPDVSDSDHTKKEESGSAFLVLMWLLAIITIIILIRYKKKIKKYGCPNCRDALMKSAEHRRINLGYLHPRIDGGPDLRYSDNPMRYRQNEVYRCPKCNHESTFGDGKVGYDYS